jgi:hypothetical protein
MRHVAALIDDRRPRRVPSSMGHLLHPLLHHRRITKDDTHNVCRCRARCLGQDLPHVEARELRETGRPPRQWPQSPQQTSSANHAPEFHRNLIRRRRRLSIGFDVRGRNLESNSWLNGARGRNSALAPIRALRLQCRAKDTPARCTPRAAESAGCRPTARSRAQPNRRCG